jgi:hypothetical protein
LIQQFLAASEPTVAALAQGTPMKKALKPHLRILMNLWPPFLGAGIRVKRLQGDWKAIDVEMKLRRWNANYFGTHYGGSLYSMSDPFIVLMLVESLGPGYIVWDKAASIRFRSPGRGTVSAEFRLAGDEVEEIRQALEVAEKIERTFQVEIKEKSGTVVAEVEKLVHIRKKRQD